MDPERKVSRMTNAFSFAAIALILGLACAVVTAPASGAAQGTPEQQQACQPDAMRLCGEFIPDVQRITACMVKKRAALSPACRVYFYPAKKKRFRRI
jgi:hypothetical protein